MRVAAELADREGSTCIKLNHIDLAEEKIERDRVAEMVLSQPKQNQAILYAILVLSATNQRTIYTGEIYEVYKSLCQKTSLRPLTQRRISDVLSEFDMFGIINAKIISKGRYGRTREVSLALTDHTQRNLKQSLEKSLEL